MQSSQCVLLTAMLEREKVTPPRQCTFIYSISCEYLTNNTVPRTSALMQHPHAGRFVDVMMPIKKAKSRDRSA
jgi:hypothetical protein